MTESSPDIPPVPAPVFAALTAEVKNTLRFMAHSGCRGFDCSPETLSILENLGKKPAPPESLQSIRSDLGECRRCKLCRTRTHIVFGTGNPKAGLVFVGDGPGYDEDRQGQPFVGTGGQMLNRMIEAMKLTREEVYLCNVIKCRPPRNRTPEPDEIAACLPFLERQIAVIRPRFICALGGTAAQSLLRSPLHISKLRGRFHDYRGIQLMPTFHPDYLSRHKEKKRETWEDLKIIMRAMGHKI